MAAPSVLSQTLHSITLTKIRELQKQQSKYESRKSNVLAQASPDQTPSRRDRIAILFKGVRELHPDALFTNNTVQNIGLWLQQSQYDASLTNEMLDGYEAQLRATLEVQTRKLRLARLYTQLVTEWMNVDASSSSSSSSFPLSVEASEEGEDSYELVDRQKERLQALCDKFEAVVFEPLETDEAAMNAYLRSLFTGEDENENKNNAKLLTRIKDHISNSERALLLEERSPFDIPTLTRAIKGLLVEDLLSEEKQDLLRDMLSNEVVLREIADVLNMRLGDLDNWSWEADDDDKKGIPVLPRQQLNGKYRIWMDEDVIQAILIHYVGMKCCVFTREALTEFVSTSSPIEGPFPVQGGSEELRGMWKWNDRVSQEERTKRVYYQTHLWTEGPSVSVQARRKSQYIETFFLSQLPETEEFYTNEYINDGEDDQAANDNRRQQDNKPQRQGNIKQKLLRLLASDVLLHRHLYGEVAVVQSDLQWYGTGLSHNAIFTVMRFLGFSPKLLEFLRKVLQAPLSMQQFNGQDGQQPTYKPPRIRQRGVPMAHAVEKLIGELILFVMDLAVNQTTGMLLYRLHDDLWLCGDPQKCTEAWATMEKFASVFGLDFNMRKTGAVLLSDNNNNNKSNHGKIKRALPTGSVRVGHLLLDPSTGNWVIDQEQVAEHVTQLRKQLASCERRSVLEWIRTWNSCIGRFFSHTFGEPAPCFGVEHAESILRTYQEMQTTLFGSPDVGVVQYVKKMLRERFGNHAANEIDIPDAFITLPEELGGLGVCNPFIRVLLAMQAVADLGTPEELLAQAHKRRQNSYETLRKWFERMSEGERIRAFAKRHPSQDAQEAEGLLRSHVGDELNTFMSFDEYMQWQEILSPDLEHAYRLLMQAPDVNTDFNWGVSSSMKRPTVDDDVRVAFNDLGSKKAHKAELEWNLQLYRDELRSGIGGMRLVEEKYLPLGVLAMMRRKAVRWNMVL